MLELLAFWSGCTKSWHLGVCVSALQFLSVLPGRKEAMLVHVKQVLSCVGNLAESCCSELGVLGAGAAGLRSVVVLPVAGLRQLHTFCVLLLVQALSSLVSVACDVFFCCLSIRERLQPPHLWP